MSVQTESRYSVSQEEEDDERFITESTELAKSFTELFISTQNTPGDTGKSPLVSHENKPAPTAPTEESYIGPLSLPVAADVPITTTVNTNPLSHAVAESLVSISRKVNDQIDAKFAHSRTQVMDKRGRTIWDIGYSDFCTIMHGVFTSLDKSVTDRSSGWEMAALVYRGVAGLVRDLRQQSGDQNHGSRAREGTLQSYVGNFLEEIGLMTWITGQGGLDQWGNNDVERYRIPHIETSV